MSSTVSTPVTSNAVHSGQPNTMQPSITLVRPLRRPYALDVCSDATFLCRSALPNFSEHTAPASRSSMCCTAATYHVSSRVAIFVLGSIILQRPPRSASVDASCLPLQHLVGWYLEGNTFCMNAFLLTSLWRASSGRALKIWHVHFSTPMLRTAAPKWSEIGSTWQFSLRV